MASSDNTATVLAVAPRAPAPNSLPFIVNAPGDYRTRNGRRVTVHEVKPYPGADLTAFTVKGSVWREFRGKLRPRDYQVWHPSGRRLPLSESALDIVGAWEE